MFRAVSGISALWPPFPHLSANWPPSCHLGPHNVALPAHHIPPFPFYLFTCHVLGTGGGGVCIEVRGSSAQGSAWSLYSYGSLGKLSFQRFSFPRHWGRLTSKLNSVLCFCIMLSSCPQLSIHLHILCMLICAYYSVFDKVLHILGLLWTVYKMTFNIRLFCFHLPDAMITNI